MSDTGNIILMGYMGTGKTAVSKALADQMDKTYVSVDDEIEHSEGKKISDIFAENGEGYFREAEKRVLKEICSRTDQVIDTGGGAVLDKENMERMLESGISFCLWAGVDEIYERTKGEDHRPLLEAVDPKERIRKMLEERRESYEKALFHIDTNCKKIEEVVKEIREMIRYE